mgnify:FL=1
MSSHRSLQPQALPHGESAGASGACAQFLWLRHGWRRFQHDDPALRKAPRFLKTTGQGNGSQDRRDHGHPGYADHHHHRHRPDPWRVHPQRNRRHQPFFLRGKLAAYAGIDPTMRQSGEYNGVRNRMSKRGSPYLRHAIWLAASSAVLHDPALKFYFQKKRDEGKPYMASVGHACRKMVSIIYAVMRDNKAYTPCIPNEISA